jgi:hypothetical protein
MTVSNESADSGVEWLEIDPDAPFLARLGQGFRSAGEFFVLRAIVFASATSLALSVFILPVGLGILATEYLTGYSIQLPLWFLPPLLVFMAVTTGVYLTVFGSLIIVDEVIKGGDEDAE